MNAGIQSYFQWSQIDWLNIRISTTETIILTIGTVILVAIIGFLLGLVLYQTKSSTRLSIKIFRAVISFFVNVFRSIPFIVLIVLLIPFTKVLVGTIIGPKAALPALVLAAAPFYARLVELGFNEVDTGALEMARSLGATNKQIIWRVLLPESLPALVSGLTVTAISIIGYTAMAGVIGAGGLGNLAYQDGFEAGQNTVTLVATLIILVIVFAFQFIGDFVVKKVDHR
ncbi:ABC transporter permease [Companilactobacillus sp. RD055328]|uniref:methionine ABC transporter permease n=1 Tax=Companilactobacillus sp. RD055328 TaxID=2916634 RepID=UPI001FC8A835|nr:methionine ABC transporter permease [Companilactobacillus sp. RD055328]GKQ43195.1 ABC transporter permease [Companilactobacillus sp. RD055328]